MAEFEAQGLSPILPEGQTRHRASASLGTTHFTLDPSLAVGERKPKNLRDVRSHTKKRSDASLQEDELARVDAAASKSLSRSMETAHEQAFEAVPEVNDKSFDALLPIMARLPRSISSEEAVAELDHSLGYFHPASDANIEGTLPFASEREGLTYTRSHLPDISSDQQYLWTALHDLRPLTTDYAGDFASIDQPILAAPHPISANADASQCPFSTTKPAATRSSLDLIRTVFNWSALKLPLHSSGEWYGVIFRSRRRVGSESTNLYTADKLSHEEAVSHGGLLMYWYGNPDAVTGMNLATCIWTDRESAKSASRLPRHREAVRHAALAYESFELSRYKVVKVQGETNLRIEEWLEV